MLNDDKCYGEKTKGEREYQECSPAGAGIVVKIRVSGGPGCERDI